MTREEAIKWIERINAKYIHGGDENFDAQRSAALEMAIYALRAQEAAEKNKPLTLDELREMDGEPVLLETGEVSIREQLIAVWEILIDHDEDCFFFTRRKRGFSAKNYGLTWLAYGRKSGNMA